MFTQFAAGALLIAFGVLLQRVFSQWQSRRKPLTAARELEDVTRVINDLVDRTQAVEASVIRLWRKRGNPPK